LFSADQHPDFQRIYRGLHKHHPDRSVRSSRGLFIGVDVIRHFLLDPANLTPNVSPRRVFLIEQAERMNESAQNALLKTLEEPPGRTNLILVTTSAERLLPTIRSRCQRVSFGLLPPEFVKTELENRTDANGPAADTLARISGGRLGAALHWHAADLLTQLAALADLLIKRDAHDPEGFGKALIAIGDPMAAQLAAAEQEQPEDKDESTAGSDNQRDALKLLFALIAELYRDALLRQTVDSDALLHILTCTAQTEQLATRVADEQCQNAIDAALQAERLLDRNVAAQLVCERLAVALGGAPLAIDQQA
jgi:DNA polymerase-3 subunit delta'